MTYTMEDSYYLMPQVNDEILLINV